MRLGLLCIVACLAPVHGAAYTDAQVREMVERQQAFEAVQARLVEAFQSYKP